MIRPPHPRSAGGVAIWLLLLPVAGAARAVSLDAGASTFESGARRYAAPEIRLEDIRVPHVEPKAEVAPPAEPEGPRFAIDRFEVTGNTLLTPTQVERELERFRGPDRTLADVEKARDALQRLYEADGFLTVAVAIPQQTVESGVVRLQVVEARVGRVAIQNPGVHWVSDERVQGELVHTVPGAVLREEDLQEDMANANRSPDARVRPQLQAGAQPGQVDVAMLVDDRIPLHGSVVYHNDHTPGSPETRMDANLSYSNLWGLGHEASVFYQFVPTSQFQDVQIFAGTYRMPMPWNENQQLFAYYAKSDTTNASTTGGGGLSILGKGNNAGVRFLLPLPGIPGHKAFYHDLTFGLDYKDILNSVVAPGAQILTPIQYMPFSVVWSGTRSGEQQLTNAKVGVNFNFAGMLTGGSRDDFQINRGGQDPKSPVTGDYQIVTLGLDHLMRVPAILRTLAAGRFVDIPAPEKSFLDDWTFDFAARGQIATQPLIATEQFGAGGVDTVRGYLDREAFGDNAYDLQLELRSPTIHRFLGGRWNEHAQLVFFWDNAQLWLLADPSAPASQSRLESLGVGLHAGVFERTTADLYLARPLIETPQSANVRLNFRLAVGF